MTTANAWCRSVNASNTNNFCLVNTSGEANNNNANNSWALAPGFHKPPKKGGLKSVTERRIKNPCERRDTSPEPIRKLPFDAVTRTLLAWRGTCARTRCMCQGKAD